jgi:hypothetical protein
MSLMPACRVGGATAAAAAPEGRAALASCSWTAARAAPRQQQLLRATSSPGSAHQWRGRTAGRAAHNCRAGAHPPAAGPVAAAGSQQGVQQGVPPLATWPATALVAARTGAYITALGLAVFAVPGPLFGAVFDAR